MKKMPDSVSPDAPCGSSSAPAKILLVEDDPQVARDIEMQLRALGYDPVAHATRGHDAIELATERRPDLVLVDIQLCGTMDGIATAQSIRTQLALPVVFLTAFAADDVLERAKLSEPFGYVLKPCSSRELRIVIEMALYKHRGLTQRRMSEAFTRTILDSVSSEIAVLDHTGQIVSVNQPWRNFALESGAVAGVPERFAEVGSNYLAVCCASASCPSASTRCFPPSTCYFAIGSRCLRCGGVRGCGSSRRSGVCVILRATLTGRTLRWPLASR